MTDAIQVMTTLATSDDANRLAQALVARRLAACAQVVGPIHSVYRWQGDIESQQEWLVTIKSLATEYDALERAIRELHPYEVPEIVAVPIVAGSAAYLAWLRGEVDVSEK